jgi:hypothetical protein
MELMTERASIDLAAFRRARHAQDVLLALLDGSPWLLKVSVRVQRAAFVLVVLVTSKTNEVRCCVPSTCNDVAVEVKEANTSRRDAP